MSSSTGSYLLRTATALTAAVVLWRADGHGRDQLRASRRLTAAALLTGAGSGLAATGYLVATGHPPAIGWLSDWLYLAYAPLAALAVLAIPREPGSHGDRTRAIADGVVAAGSLWFMTMVLVIEPQGLGSDLPATAHVVTVAYALLPTFLIAVILSALPRATRAARPFLARACAGVALLGISDLAFSIATWNHAYRPDSWIAGLAEAGLISLVAAAFAGAGPRAGSGLRADSGNEPEAPPVRPLMGALPYMPLFVSILVAFTEFARGGGISHAEVPAVLLTATAVVVRHLASAQQHARLLHRLAARERAAREEAESDPLTGLMNRSAFLSRLEAALADPAEHPVAVALLDLNDFKDINDTHGHGTGDEVLRRTAALLTGAAAPGTRVARLGGDEFAAYAPRSTDGGHALAESIRAAFEWPVRVGARSFDVRPSVGVVVDERPVGGSQPGDASHLMAHADVAMYRAKGSKATQIIPVAVLTGQDRAEAAATIRIRDEIGTPDLEQFHVVYQPLVDLRTGQVVGAEALLRWSHPRFGAIPPDSFIGLAEDVGSIGTLGQFAMTQALDEVARWSAAAGRPMRVGVNVSPRQMSDPQLARQVLEMVAARGLDPGQLVIEVTEESLVDDLAAAVTTVDALRRAGVSVAVDDFGTGYSSLRYLRQFHVDVVKIDREFVQACAGEPRTAALVRSVVEMARQLDLRCVAEGIETLDQLRIVQATGCEYGQGYLLARPMGGDALLRLLVDGRVYPVDVADPEPGAACSVVPLRLSG